MRLPGRHLVSLAVLCVLLTGCGPTAPSSPQGSGWRFVAADVRGAIITDGEVTRGYLRGEPDPTWEVEGEANGGFCAENCPDAVLSFDGKEDVLRTRDQARRWQELSDRTAATEVRVLMSSLAGRPIVSSFDGASVKVHELNEEGDLRTLASAKTSAGPLWYGHDHRGTLYLPDDGRPQALAVSADRLDTKVSIAGLSTPFLCLDKNSAVGTAPPPETLSSMVRRLEYVSACFTLPGGRWIGVSTFIAADEATGAGVPHASFVTVDQNGREVWQQTFVDSDRYALALDGQSLALVVAGTLTLLDARSGQQFELDRRVRDVAFADDSTLVSVDGEGALIWDAYDGQSM